MAALIVGLQGHGKSLPSVIARDLIDKIEQEEAAGYCRELHELRRKLRQDADGDDREKIQEELARMERIGRPAIIIATQASVEGLLEALSSHRAELSISMSSEPSSKTVIAST